MSLFIRGMLCVFCHVSGPIQFVYNPAYVGAREGPPGAVQWPGGEEESEAHCTHTSLEHCWIYAGYISVCRSIGQLCVVIVYPSM